MTKKIVSLALILLMFTLTASAKNLIFLEADDTSHTGLVFELWMDTDRIQPIGQYSPSRGNVEIVDGIFSFRYEMKARGYEVTAFIDGLADFQSMEVLNAPARGGRPEWSFNMRGSDGLPYRAYLVEHYEEIMERPPFVVRDEYLPKAKEREPFWPMTERGWLKVYEREDGSEAWVKPISAVLSQKGEADLPLIRVLVRRSDVVDGSKGITYSYEEYDPTQRTRKSLQVWNETKEPSLFMTQGSYPMKTNSKDAAIGSMGYISFIQDISEVSKRNFFKIGDPPEEIPLEWLDF